MAKESLTTREEVFAPVVALYRFKTEEEAIWLANDCDVGLGSFIMTESISRSWRVAEALEVGMVGVNIGLLSACENPFGGMFESTAVKPAHMNADNRYVCRRQAIWVRKRGWPRRHLGIRDGQEHLYQCGQLRLTELNKSWIIVFGKALGRNRSASVYNCSSPCFPCVCVVCCEVLQLATLVQLGNIAIAVRVGL